MEPGLEFRAAARAAEAVQAQVVLGDRPIEITLERAWTALDWKQRFRLCRDLLSASLAPVPDVSAARQAPPGLCIACRPLAAL